MASIADGFKIESRNCMVTIGRAIREDWQISNATKDDIIRQLDDIIKNDSRDRWRIRATKLVALMTQQNRSMAVKHEGQVDPDVATTGPSQPIQQRTP